MTSKRSQPELKPKPLDALVVLAVLLGVSLLTGTLTGFVASLLFRAMKNIYFTQ